jgi:hypothetical protein
MLASSFGHRSNISKQKYDDIDNEKQATAHSEKQAANDTAQKQDAKKGSKRYSTKSEIKAEIKQTVIGKIDNTDCGDER